VSDLDKKLRFEELCAGQALGDLSHDEAHELQGLAAELGLNHDLAFDMLAASLEADLLAAQSEPMPADFAARLKQNFREIEVSAPSNIVHAPVSVWGRLFRSPFTGWAAAAAVLLFTWLGREQATDPAGQSSPAVAEARLRKEATDLIERQFTGVGDFAQASGKVVWSDAAQQGYMTLQGIPANDPQKAQYQLWIVDPTRDEAPVDGGVFDIPADGSPVLVPIVAKLALKNPQAFVITLEQPGGVVKSKLEQVIALAKG
jgi:anti-sigma-K factor RskA